MMAKTTACSTGANTGAKLSLSLCIGSDTVISFTAATVSDRNAIAILFLSCSTKHIVQCLCRCVQ